MSIDHVNISFAPIPMDRVKEIFFDLCPKTRTPEVLRCSSMEALKDKCISAVPLEFEHAVDVHVNSEVTANIRSENSETRSET